jgi:hypothetical protein
MFEAKKNLSQLPELDNSNAVKINKVLCFGNITPQLSISVLISMEAFLTQNIQGYARIN